MTLGLTRSLTLTPNPSLGLTRSLTLTPNPSLGLTRSLTLTPFGPNQGRIGSTLMGTGGTSSPPGADTSVPQEVPVSSLQLARGGGC